MEQPMVYPTSKTKQRYRCTVLSRVGGGHVEVDVSCATEEHDALLLAAAQAARHFLPDSTPDQWRLMGFERI